MPDNPYDYAAPRPYAWKTDEFQTHSEPRSTVPIDRPNGATQHIGRSPAPLAYRHPQQFSPAFHCPRCMSSLIPRMERRVSTAGWITFAVLLVFFFPLFWIGLLIKEDVQVCPACNSKTT